MNLLKKSLFALALTVSTSAVALDSFAVSGTHYINTPLSEKTETREVEAFNGISVSTGIDVFIAQGNAEKVTVTADDDIISSIKTEVKGGILNIYVDKKNNKSWSWTRNNTMKVYLTVKELNSITASSGSDVSTTNTLKSAKLFVQSSSGSDINLALDAGDLICESSSGSDMKLSGIAKSLNVKSSSGSDISAYELTSEVCVANASSGSDIEVTVTKQLTAHASSGGDVSYKGNPQNVVKNESSGGDVSHN
ncbi:head GIN domain-containing protein [Solitalea canadensis]|uniref:Putative auto-transporter adhesin head GIN domain-containing protein n=1 Tax=Solitalea canadensis (strain ATCC 29591 / DSM 3403 / JCM 21819 / LMG 8368 / NBRC 15130 / NCIMB 12057 / USAM 9D) TaxID=929556 RepID=H8KMG1_SOLCM|nr:head GIN domain-containing protein [Solitalea canadensis]AFD08756.1 Protein of unknown function (DUF2807) [Solitalea canadensis DSM 3403]